MRSVLFIICILTLSCSNNTNFNSTKISEYDSILIADNFDTTTFYGDKSCLLYKGKSLLTLGQNIKLFDTTFSYNIDANGSYQNFTQLGLTDYFSNDNFYKVKLSTGTIEGTINFSTDRQKRIIKLFANFYIDADLVDTSGMEIMNYLQDNYFHCLPIDFKGRQKFELTHKNFIEQFNLYRSPDSADIEHGFKPHWSLDYIIKPIKKNGL